MSMDYVVYFEQINAQQITVEANSKEEAVDKATKIWLGLNQPEVVDVEQ